MSQTKAQTPSSQNEIRTTDLTLASYLVTRGHHPSLVKSGSTKDGHPIGSWVFAGGEQLRGHLRVYSDGLGKVEPLAFHKAIKATRRQMFDYLGIGHGS